MSLYIDKKPINPIAVYKKNYINLTDDKEKGDLGFKFPSDDVEITPTTTKERDCIYISGPSGAGKSTLVSKFIKRYVLTNPKNDIYLFSNVKDDPAFNEFGKLIKKIKIDADLILDPIDIKEELGNSLVIMDDVDMIPNKQIKEAVTGIRDEILQCGRHYNISCILTTHNLTNYGATRIILNECNNVIFFPKAGSLYNIQRFLKVYCGLSNKQISDILNIDSRWVCMKKDYPNAVISSNSVGLL